jgi:hypothetical protein
LSLDTLAFEIRRQRNRNQPSCAAEVSGEIWRKTTNPDAPVIDMAQQKVVGTEYFGRGVRTRKPLLGPKDRLPRVTTELDFAITLIFGSIPTAQNESRMMSFSHDGRRAYSANVGPCIVSVLDTEVRRNHRPHLPQHPAHLHH